MLDYLCEWIQRVAYYMILVTLVMQVTAGEGYKKYIRLFTGIILILFILAPVIRLLGLDGKEFVSSAQREYEAAAENIEEKIQILGQRAVSNLEEGKTAEDIEEEWILRETGKGEEETEREETAEKDNETGKIEVGEIRIGR